jgi:hypothetical protein
MSASTDALMAATLSEAAAETAGPGPTGGVVNLALGARGVELLFGDFWPDEEGS